MTIDEKKRLTAERSKAVRNAWKNEQALVMEGKGTRQWSKSEQKELIENGHISGYEGHHMKSVSEYPEYAGDSKNIQFLTREEHINGAHQGNTQNQTNGYYNTETRSIEWFEGEELKEQPTFELSEVTDETYSKTTEQSYNVVESDDYSNDWFN